MRKLHQLLKTAHAVSKDVDIHLRGTADDNIWVCSIYLGKDVILFSTEPGKLDDVVKAALDKLKGMSREMQAVMATPADDRDSDPPKKV